MVTIAGLSDDSLSNIFSFCCATDQQAFCSPLDEAPLVLTRICQRWRTVAFATPELWNKVKITPSASRSYARPPQKLTFKGYTWVLRHWIEHSGALPLSVDVHFPLEQAEAAAGLDAERQALLDLKLQSHRVKHLSLSLWTQTFIDLFITANSPMPAIEELTLQLNRERGSWSKLDIASSKLLRRLDIEGTGLYVEPNAPNLELIQSLSLQYCNLGTQPPEYIFTVAYLFNILDNCPALQEFTSYLRLADQEEIDDEEAVKRTHSGLRTLTLIIPSATTGEGRQTDVIQTFINAIKLPNLEHLECTDPYHWEEEMTWIHPFLETSQPPLRTLYLHIPVFEADILRCLPLLPELTTLRLSSPFNNLGNDIFEGLSPDDICPKLTNVCIQAKSIFPDTVKMFLLSRCPHPDPRDGATADCVHLEHVTLYRCTWRLPCQIQDDNLVQMCIKHGLELVIT